MTFTDVDRRDTVGWRPDVGCRSLIDELSTCQDAIVVATSKDPNAKITFLLLDRDGHPTRVIKAPTTDLAAEAVEAEGRLLLALAEMGGGLQGCIPRVLDVIDYRGRPALVTSALPGVALGLLYHRWRHTSRKASVAKDFEAVGEWIGRFQTASSDTAVTTDADLIPHVILRYGSRGGLDELLSRYRRIRDRIGPRRTVSCAEHGDLWFGNVLMSGSSVSGVVDWEAGRLAGDPLRDVVRFALTYALYLDRHTRSGGTVSGHPGLRRGSWGAGVSYLIEGRGWFPALVGAFVREHCRRLGVSPVLWRDALLIGLVDVAATADDHTFGAKHLELFARLTDGKQP